MRLSLLCLELSAAQHLSEEVRHRMRGCLAVLKGPPTSLDCLLSPDDAGLVLAAALVGGDPGEAVSMVRGATLSTLDLEAGGEHASLPPDALTDHPLFGPWVALTLAGAVAKAVMAGAALTNLAFGAPVIDSLELIPNGDGLSGRLSMQFATSPGHQVNASAVYGETADLSPIAAVTRVQGVTLIALGMTARQLTQTNSTRPEGATDDTPTGDHVRDPAVTVH
jgi:hypothetical protein